MSNYKVTYFDFHGGRGEPIRIALHAAGLAFEDVRWSFADFAEKRSALPFSAVPTLEIDGMVISQSNAICRYIGKSSGLYPEDALQALYCDEVLEALEDLNHYFVQTFGLEEDALKEAREKLMHGKLTIFLQGLEKLLARGGGKYFAGGQLSIADLRMFLMLKHFRSGTVDHIPQDFADKLTPALVAYQARIEAEPVVVGYYDSIS